jgi:O-antigen/teichoic acid export membrane protein
LLSLNLLVKPIWIFGIDRTVQNLVGDQNYGIYFSLFNFSVLMNILLDLGITNYNNRNISQHRFLLNKHLSNIVTLKLFLAIAYTVVTFGIALIIGYNRIQFHLLLFLVINQFLISFILYLRSNIAALYLFRTDSFLSVLDRTLMIAICGLLLFSNITGVKFTIEWFVYIQTIAYAGTALITFFIVLSKSGTIRLKLNLNFSLVFLKKSYPYALLILLMSFYNRIDSVMIERLLPGTDGEEQAGIYAQAFRLLDAVSMFGVLFAGMLLPIFSRMIKHKEPLAQMVRLSFTFLFVLAVLIATSSVFYKEEIMGLLYHSNVHLSSQILGILMPGFIGIAGTYIFGTLLTANGSMKQLNLMAASFMVLNVLLNLILIPRFSAYGSAYASLTTQLIAGIAQLLLVISVFKFKPDKKYLLQLLVFVIATVLIGWLSQFIPNKLAGYSGMLLAGLLVALIIKLINLRDIFFILRNE